MQAYDIQIYTLDALRLLNSTYMLAPSVASSSVPPEQRRVELACVDWMIERYSSILENQLMDDAPAHTVLTHPSYNTHTPPKILCNVSFFDTSPEAHWSQHLTTLTL